jgi:hypothetical protein
VASGVEKRIGNYLITTRNGVLTVNPASATVTITGHTNTAAYDGKKHIVSGYDVKIDNPLYRETDFTFTGRAANAVYKGFSAIFYPAIAFTKLSPNFHQVTNG